MCNLLKVGDFIWTYLYRNNVQQLAWKINKDRWLKIIRDKQCFVLKGWSELWSFARKVWHTWVDLLRIHSKGALSRRISCAIPWCILRLIPWEAQFQIVARVFSFSFFLLRFYSSCTTELLHFVVQFVFIRVWLFNGFLFRYTAAWSNDRLDNNFSSTSRIFEWINTGSELYQRYNQIFFPRYRLRSVVLIEFRSNFN